MKVLFISPLGRKEKEEFIDGTSYKVRELNSCIKSYYLAHPECSIDLKLECRTGTDYRETSLEDIYGYFNDKDIKELICEIESLIQSDEIIGLIIDPILTFEDEKLYMYSSLVPGDILEMIYNQFSDKLPICYYLCAGGGQFYKEAICKRMNEEYSKEGYTKENGYFELPRMNYENYFGEYESMIKYFIDFYYKRKTENSKLERIKKENK